MDTEIRISTSQKVERALEEQGRRKTWLAEQFGVTPQTIQNKLRENSWSVAEVLLLQQLLKIN